MNNEELNSLQEYGSRLEEVLKHFREEKENLEKEEDSSRKEKRIASIEKNLNELEEMQARLSELNSTNEMIAKIESLEDCSEDDAKNMLEEIAAEFKNQIKNETNNLDLTAEELLELDNTTKELNKKLRSLKRKQKSLSGEELENNVSEMEKIEKKLANINEYQMIYDDKKELFDKIKSIPNLEDEEKDSTIDECLEAYDEKLNLQKEAVASDMNKFDKIEKKVKKSTDAKKENEEKTHKLSDKTLKITAVVAGIALAFCIGYVANHFVEKEDYDDDKDNTPSSSDSINEPDNKDINDIIDQVEDITNPVVLALIEKGYNEYSSKLMVENFDESTIAALLSYYRPEAEKYANCKDFHLDYLDNYEYAFNKYETTSENIVDYVNRSYNIQATGFYNEADIKDICDVVVAIDNKTLFFEENANLAQSFNTAFNAITENYLFGNPTENDVTKMDALQYFAKEGTDMDAFLTNYAEIIKDILNNPKDNNYKTELYNYLKIFAYRNGITNDTSVLTNNDEFNNAADLDDYYDWFMAYNSFIAPLYPLAYPQVVELPATTPIIPEGATQEMIDAAWADLNAEWARVEEENSSIDYKMRELEDLQVYMITVLNGPEYDNFCLANNGLIR